MKNSIFIILICSFLYSCIANKEVSKLNIKNAELAHSKFSDLNKEFSYKEYKTLIIEYGKNYNYPEIKD